MTVDVIGWDVGGAHLKAAALNGAGEIVAIIQEPCPLWQGIDRLHAAMSRILDTVSPRSGCRHAVTMTGELADCFENREQGVLALVQAMTQRCPQHIVRFFAGYDGFLDAEAITPESILKIASANWLASALWVADNLREAVFIDVGSTTTDIALIHDHRVETRGYADFERMRYDELIYSGVVRTPVMAIADRAPFEGEWIGLMAEHFATAADVYRLCGELPEHADQMPAADGGEKTFTGSARRLARLFGRDLESAPMKQWRQAARFFRERQLMKLRSALDRQLSRGLIGDDAPLIGAGVGRFLVRELAARSGFPYKDFSELFSMLTSHNDFQASDCAPAAAVACLAMREVGAS
ncbi:hydantoinase/oxoprolinase family protein [Methylocaldum szegediense]|uniref:(4-(4-[2-(Gamma-L-glutamylamino)ethyl]phenoxymethyl)furan-2-yl)methanamine synthase n=1 Tax=Methylocaldum szegediense TaxID=73780 RepID=A0ABM9I3V8_9GAMM|nr:hydantoinase/oxoprolinase family protein [Methylocaldum szegediense]CAI8872747.1 (4-(4-[2-(gamma-L-glutamylamino)ethyl]phenoxymethyl)furan-2-yl)methanamine synthase [Methylocaldum szegediense]